MNRAFIAGVRGALDSTRLPNWGVHWDSLDPWVLAWEGGAHTQWVMCEVHTGGSEVEGGGRTTDPRGPSLCLLNKHTGSVGASGWASPSLLSPLTSGDQHPA